MISGRIEFNVKLMFTPKKIQTQQSINKNRLFKITFENVKIDKNNTKNGT